MAEIVLGIGSSHTPQVSMGAAMWETHASTVDVQLVDMESARAAAPGWIIEEVAAQRFDEKYQECTANIDLLRETLSHARVDVVLVLGDDHREVFTDECSPSVAVYCGDEVADLPSPEESLTLESLRASDWAYHGREPVTYATAGDMAQHVVGWLSGHGFDPTVVAKLGDGRSIGHAFTFVKRRLAPEPGQRLLPVWLNAFYGANVPSAERCYALGQALRAAVEAWPGDERVAVVASGGLSHYVVDEGHDRQLLDAIAAGDSTFIKAVPGKQLESGSGEIRMWIAAAGACEGLAVTHATYVPGYRSVAATGVGLGFMTWSGPATRTAADAA